MATIHPTKYYCTVSYSQKYYYIIAIYNNNNNSAGMKERCRDGCRTSLLIAGVVLVPAIFHTLLPPCHPYITIHFMEMIFSTCTKYNTVLCDNALLCSCACSLFVLPFSLIMKLARILCYMHTPILHLFLYRKLLV